MTSAKNDLDENEISKLDRFVVMSIEFAEMHALNKQIMEMLDWLQNVDNYAR